MAGRFSKKKKAGVDVWFGKSAEDLPYKKISPLSPEVFASYSGPDKGLAVVEELQNGNTENGITPNSPNKKSDIAGAVRWNFKNRKAYGICMSLYDQHPINGKISGDPIADSFGLCARKNSALLIVADGVNWGEKSRLAARCAVYGCMKFMNDRLFPGQKSGLRNTHDAFNLLLKSLDVAHESIITHEGGLTTLCAALVLPAKDTKQFVVCIVNVGDSLGYVFSKRHGIREITTGSHDIQSERDIRDAGGALGPVNGKDPELHNLTCSMTYVDRGDIVYLTTDGISDNFDPVVTKIAVPKKYDTTPTGNDTNANDSTIISPSTECGVKDGKPEMEPHERHLYATKEMERIIHEFELFTEMPCSAQELCGALLQHVLKLTDSKRKVLENPDLYGKKLRSKDRKRRDSEIVSKMSRAPGKLDHATIVGYEVGKYHGNEDEDYEAMDSDAESSLCGSYLTTEDSDFGRSRDDLDDIPNFVLPSEDYDVVSPISEDTFRNLRGDATDDATDDEIEDPFEYIDTEKEDSEEDELTEEEVEPISTSSQPAEDTMTSQPDSEPKKQKTWPAAKKSRRKRPEPKRDRAMGLLLYLQPNLSYPVMNHADIGHQRNHQLIESIKKFGIKRKKPEEAKPKEEAPDIDGKGEDLEEAPKEDDVITESKDLLTLERETDMEVTPETEPEDKILVDESIEKTEAREEAAAGEVVEGAPVAGEADESLEIPAEDITSEDKMDQESSVQIETITAQDVSVVAAAPQAASDSTESTEVTESQTQEGIAQNEGGLVTVETIEIKDVEMTAAAESESESEQSTKEEITGPADDVATPQTTETTAESADINAQDAQIIGKQDTTEETISDNAGTESVDPAVQAESKLELEEEESQEQQTGEDFTQPEAAPHPPEPTDNENENENESQVQNSQPEIVVYDEEDEEAKPAIDEEGDDAAAAAVASQAEAAAAAGTELDLVTPSNITAQQARSLMVLDISSSLTEDEQHPEDTEADGKKKKVPTATLR